MEKDFCIALDTEYIAIKQPEFTLAIVQVGLSTGEVHLIDALAFDNLSGLRSVLERQDIVKILHDAAPDLVLLSRASGATPKNIFDTRIAARLLSVNSQNSLAALVAHICKVRISKKQQQSNWRRRPLSTAQIRYAEGDVLYLHQIRKALLSRAHEIGRVAWLDEEMSRFDNPHHYLEPSPIERILSSSEAYSFKPQQRAVVAAVVDWRFHTALKTRTALKKLLDDKEIIRLAKGQRKMPGAVRNACSSLPHRYIPQVANVVAKALDTPTSACPKAVITRPFPNEKQPHLRLLQALVGRRALEYKIDAELIATSKTLQRLIQDPDKRDTPLLNGWRWEVVGKDLLRILQGESSVEITDDVLRVRSVRA
jgi:ribonuclease D